LPSGFRCDRASSPLGPDALGRSLLINGLAEVDGDLLRPTATTLTVGGALDP
jgi:hypothetical protein